MTMGACVESVDMSDEEVAHNDIAQNGNGQNNELSKEQWNLLHQLQGRVAPYREVLPWEDRDFCDLETCRRYLVANQWNLKRAEAQLVSTLNWRTKERPWSKPFWQSPKALENPLALSMRIVGWDIAGRPIAYTCFAEAHDRWDAEANSSHVQRLLVSCENLIRQRRKRGLNRTADSRQAIWVVDFDGFGFRDQDPRSAVTTAHVLQHFPEMMHMVVLMDAPMLFNGVFRLMSPLLDERVKSKILFVKGKDAGEFLKQRLGKEAAEWIENETKDNKEKRSGARKGNPKKYWIEPKNVNEHNPRGIGSYVTSDLYDKTPGDAFEELIKCSKEDGCGGVEPEKVRARTLLRGSSFPDSSVIIE